MEYYVDNNLQNLQFYFVLNKYILAINNTVSIIIFLDSIQ